MRQYGRKWRDMKEMIPYERCEKILNLAQRKDFVTISDLLQIVDGCSIATLRRDIDRLANQGRIEKIRGGVRYKKADQQSDSSYLYRNREKLFMREKELIGQAAQEFVIENDVILLTDGTTTSQVAKHIDPRKHVTVITNGLDVISHLSDKENLNVILLGGIVDFSCNVITGHSVHAMLDELNPTKLIMGAGGITEEKGITCYDFLQSSFLSKIIKEVQTCIIVADHSKFDRNALVQIADLDCADVVITDRGIPPKYSGIFERQGIQNRIV